MSKALSHARSTFADRQFRRALSVLRKVRWNELDENARKEHEGILKLMTAIHAQSALKR